MTPFSRISDFASSLARARVFKTFRLHFLMSMLKVLINGILTYSPESKS